MNRIRWHWNDAEQSITLNAESNKHRQVIQNNGNENYLVELEPIENLLIHNRTNEIVLTQSEFVIKLNGQ